MTTTRSQDNAGDGEQYKDLPLRIGVGQFKQPTEERLRFIKQLGADDILLNMYQTPLLERDDLPLTGEKEWSLKQLVKLRNKVETAGLRLNAIENIPISFYDQIMLGGDKKEEQFDHVKNTIKNIGRAGIPVLGYHWSPSGVWRTSTSQQIRGGAKVTAFDRSDINEQPLTHGREYTEEEMWNNYLEFLEKVLPVAEKAGVKLALHPNDPPIEKIGGVPFLFRNFQNFKKAMDAHVSDHHGLEFCIGTWSEMGEDLFEVIEYFGGDKIFYVHFRDVEGTVPSFNETFIDEGNYNEYEILRLLDKVGFSGMIIPDHVPNIQADTEWGHRGRAYTVGYLRGMLKTINN
jgi:mannonate dehydratase